MLFHSPRLEALPLSISGYGREVIIRIGFSCVDGGFPKKTKMPTWFGFMKYQLFSIMRDWMWFFYRLFVIFLEGG